jgi:hypothetical protein
MPGRNPVKELNWGGLGTSVAAGRLIARKEPFVLALRGQAADALRKVAGPGMALDRALLSTLAANWSLAALPGLMLYALGSGYHLSYELLGNEGIRMRFLREEPGAPKETGQPPRRDPAA